MATRRKPPLKINLGAGQTQFPGWSNLDLDERNRPDIVDDFTTLKKVKTNSVDVIFASHVLEHVPWKVDVLKTWKRVLKKSGQLIIAVPDIQMMFLLHQTGAITDEYLQATCYGSWMLGDDPEFMTHHRCYSMHLLIKHVQQHFPRLIVGRNENCPRPIQVGELCVTGVNV